MATVARVKKEGSLLLKETIDERLPVITDGLVAYYPLDSKAGAIDVVRGAGTIQNVESEINILDALAVPWTNGSSWGAGGGIWDEVEQALRFDIPEWHVFDTLIPIDTSKNWYIEATMKQGASATGNMYLGTISYDANLNVLPGHPGSYDYFGNCGPSVPTTWTLYKNTWIEGVPRTGESSDTGSATTWHTGTKYVRILIITNYSNQIGPTWVKNLKFYNSSVDTSNVIVTEEGVAVQQGTTNLYAPYVNIGLDWLNSGTTPVINNNDYSLGKPIKDDNVNVRTFYRNGTGNYHFGFTTVPTSINTKYTMSVWYYQSRFNDETLPYVRGGVSNASYGTLYWIENNSTDATTWPTKKWIRLARTFTTDSTDTTVYLSGYPGSYNKIGIYAPQLETKDYPTSFVNGTRYTSALSIPNPVKTGDYTINFKCSIPTQVGVDATPDYYITIMQMGNYYTTNSWTIMDQGGSTISGYQALIRKGAADEWEWMPAITTPDNFNKENTYTIVRNSTHYLGYLNGNYIASLAHLSTTMQDLIWIGSKQDGYASRSSIISDLAIYNRALSEQEIKALAGEGFKVTTTKAVTPLIKESPAIPLDAYYFPLATDTKDSSKTIDATDNTNIVFEDGAAWVGTATTNLFNSPTNFASTDWNKGGITTFEPNLVKFTGDYAPLYQPKGTYANGNVYSITWRMAGMVDGQKIRVALENAVDGGYPEVTLSRYMKTYFRNGTANGTGNFNPLLYQFPGDNGSGANNISVIRLLWAQLEQKSFPSPFTSGTRGASSLEYNLYNSIGLDWSGNWTICYWKKPMGTYTDDFVGYNIESVGCNSNSVGGGYTWYGKNNGDNSIYNSTPGTFSPEDYFNKWQFISIVRNGSNFTVKTTLDTGAIHTAVFAGTGNANGYVTQYGYDLKLGGWDNGQPTNTYFRDLIVVKRALSDAEIQNIYKQFSIYKTNINTSNLIEEGI